MNSTVNVFSESPWYSPVAHGKRMSSLKKQQVCMTTPSNMAMALTKSNP
jgi:hypothetical protein